MICVQFFRLFHVFMGPGAVALLFKGDLNLEQVQRSMSLSVLFYEDLFTKSNPAVESLVKHQLHCGLHYWMLECWVLIQTTRHNSKRTPGNTFEGDGCAVGRTFRRTYSAWVSRCQDAPCILESRTFSILESRPLDQDSCSETRNTSFAPGVPYIRSAALTLHIPSRSRRSSKPSATN